MREGRLRVVEDPSPATPPFDLNQRTHATPFADTPPGARQGMIIVVPQGDVEDATRKPEFYDPTFEYLQDIGLTTI